MALGDFMAARQQCEERIVSRLHLGGSQAASLVLEEGIRGIQDDQNMEASIYHNTGRHDPNPNDSFLPSTVYFGDAHRGAYEASSSAGPAENGLVSKIRMKDRVSAHFEQLLFFIFIQMFFAITLILKCSLEFNFKLNNESVVDATHICL